MKIPIIDQNLPEFKSPDKEFLDWMFKKDALHATEQTLDFREGEIWWAALGENIGIEINGKSERFSRPILVFRRLGPLGLMAIPLTSQPHKGSWYRCFRFRGRLEYAVLAQARVISAKRLYRKIGSVSDKNLANIRRAFCNLYK